LRVAITRRRLSVKDTSNFRCQPITIERLARKFRANRLDRSQARHSLRPRRFRLWYGKRQLKERRPKEEHERDRCEQKRPKIFVGLCRKTRSDPLEGHCKAFESLNQVGLI